MAKITTKELLDAGVHFGHLTRKWDPQMAPFIFMEKNGIHIIDLNKSLQHLEEACAALQAVVRSGRKIMFVATKKQAKEIVEEQAKKAKNALCHRKVARRYANQLRYDQKIFEKNDYH